MHRQQLEITNRAKALLVFTYLAWAAPVIFGLLNLVTAQGRTGYISLALLALFLSPIIAIVLLILAVIKRAPTTPS